MPVLEAGCASEIVDHSGQVEPFGLAFRALDSLKPGEVYICTGSSLRYALWGELMSTRVRTVGAAGAVLDGYHRDTRGVLNVGLPVYSQGSYAQDQRLRGRVVDYRCEIEFANGARVAPGDLIVGDIDGGLTIPYGSADAIVHSALAKVKGRRWCAG
jgi:regulator of RNase E activity RraA